MTRQLFNELPSCTVCGARGPVAMAVDLRQAIEIRQYDRDSQESVVDLGKFMDDRPIVAEWFIAHRSCLDDSTEYYAMDLGDTAKLLHNVAHLAYKNWITGTDLDDFLNEAADQVERWCGR